MTKTSPEQEPEVAPFDPSGMTVEERLARLEDLVTKIAMHQVNLGRNLIAMVADVNAITEDMLASGVTTLAQENRENSKPVIVDRAPLIHPGGHPLRPTKG